MRREHDWAALLSDLAGQKRSIIGFGASDCRCPTHLFFGTNPLDTDEFARRSAHCFPADGPVEVIRCT
jgi:Uri superfamily endonuclease